MKDKVLHYSNPDSDKFSRITREFISSFCYWFSLNFSNEATQSFISKTRIPNERELYGVFVKSLFDFKESDSMHVATEVKVKRKSEGDSSTTGRVDIVVRYRRVTFLLEIKVCRIPLDGLIEEDEELTVRAVKSWHSACEQLKILDVTSLGKILESERVIKMPLVLFLYFSGRGKINDNPLIDTVWKTKQILRSVNENSINEVYFSYFDTFENALETYKRKDQSLVGGKKIYLHGFSFLSTVIER